EDGRPPAPGDAGPALDALGGRPAALGGGAGGEPPRRPAGARPLRGPAEGECDGRHAAEDRALRPPAASAGEAAPGGEGAGGAGGNVGGGGRLLPPGGADARLLHGGAAPAATGRRRRHRRGAVAGVVSRKRRGEVDAVRERPPADPADPPGRQERL